MFLFIIKYKLSECRVYVTNILSIFLVRISNVSTSSEDIIDSNLRINIKEKHLYGDYVCKASNILGTTEVTINLYGKYCIVLEKT